MTRRKHDPRSPIQSVRNPWWAPIALAFLAATAFWTWQQVRIGADQPEKSRMPLAEHAKADLPALFSSDDYPREAIVRDEQGTVAFTLTINRRGRVSKCAVSSSSGSQALDRATCKILTKRARFVPARNSRGERVADEFSGRIRWELPEE